MRKALIVGIDNYEKNPLSGCVNDAMQIKEVLSRNHDETSNFECKILTSPQTPIVRPFLLASLDQFFLQEAEVALFYFSGHGVVNNIGGYLGTVEMKSYDEGISMMELLTLINNSSTKEVIVILDCCHSGKLGIVPALQKDHTILREGVSILCASRGNETAQEQDSGGLFTALICDALNGGASDIVGNVTVASVYAFVDQALGAWYQRPLFKSNVSKFTPLRKCQPAVVFEILRLLPRYFFSPDDKFLLNPTFEETEPTAILENVKIFKHLQKFRAVRLLEPGEGEEALYWAAVRSKSCHLTELGKFYWKLAKDGKIKP